MAQKAGFFIQGDVEGKGFRRRENEGVLERGQLANPQLPMPVQYYARGQIEKHLRMHVHHF
eukprot:1157476-Pelagomonas_calceolata.AAC.3